MGRRLCTVRATSKSGDIDVQLGAFMEGHRPTCFSSSNHIAGPIVSVHIDDCDSVWEGQVLFIIFFFSFLGF